jgi:hypothetical protein
MRRVLILSAALLVCLLPALHAQTVLSTSILQSDLGPETPTAIIAHGSSISVGQVVFVFDEAPEAMYVAAVSGSRVTLQRGYLGSAAQAHTVGALVYYGAASAFASSDPSPGASCSGASAVPSITPQTGRVFACIAAVWTQLRPGILPDDYFRLPQGNALASLGSTSTPYDDLHGYDHFVWARVLMNNRLLVSTIAPTVASGFGTSPVVTAPAGTGAFRLNVGTGGTASEGVLTMPATVAGWNCAVENLTATAANDGDQRTVQTASTTTSVTVENQTISTGAAVAWTASDVLALTCLGF